ncbi:flagellar motor switch protein FliG [Exiguobacterium sp. Leaf187]|uniref:Flagellar motor switch protein FliG n=1 Tax=Exiguobacterium indicum TaxID=296995 RepID=A0A0V8GK85_9BACL|nr:MULTISPECIES: flagellar motor switch protein FliG [Exiguobacterium]AHA30107.1 flagellar motor switch protein FliG [Exiguobacterium sp. MH3]KOP29656.1 flagellar motor switch protein FliG [Exiguobacterium sp. BMC-KP]KQS19351.1 flagellar motor switch protein FliG [Exiguobacterium sp. Leaf187]KSU50637.1 flagellar motor switch protein FliG [Exiguobacterium enclense]KTR26484.1 flagellar motor switch protein FliG [Exiguobacterium indicum]
MKKLEMNSREKAAVLMISLGPEVAANVYKHLSEEEMEWLTLQISSMKRIDPEDKAGVLDEFHDLAMAQNYITQGGIGFAKSVLEKAVGEEKAMELIHRLTSTLQVRPFEFARKADSKQLLNFIQNEHPQTIALVLAHLDPAKSGQILSELPAEAQSDVARRIATMDRMNPEIISEVELILERNLSQAGMQDYAQSGGIEAVVQVLNGVDRTTERTILDTLEIQDPELAEEIKKRMFVFEDIVTLDARAIQRIIREVSNEDLLLALKVSSDDVKDMVYRNMSQRMVESFKEDMEFMGPVRLRDVEEAQSRIVGIIRRLEDMGEIVVARGGGDDIVV